MNLRLFTFSALLGSSLNLFGSGPNDFKIFYNESINMNTKSVGLKYLDFINHFGRSDKDNFAQEIESLFLPNIKKVVNSKTICQNRNELMQQMNEVKKIYGLHSMNLLELFISDDKQSNILRWEITYNDNTTESVITILKYNNQGLISEINEVFGQKEIYQWPENKNRLVELAQDYLQFMHDVGSAQSIQSDDVRIKSLFAENLTKIDNRSILFENNRDLLLPQMRSLKDPRSNKTDWIIVMDKAIIVPSLETHSIVIHFEWINDNIGKGTTMAILQCNNNNQIERITDVWAKVQTADALKK